MGGVLTFQLRHHGNGRSPRTRVARIERDQPQTPEQFAARDFARACRAALGEAVGSKNQYRFFSAADFHRVVAAMAKALGLGRSSLYRLDRRGRCLAAYYAYGFALTIVARAITSTVEREALMRRSDRRRIRSLAKVVVARGRRDIAAVK